MQDRVAQRHAPTPALPPAAELRHRPHARACSPHPRDGQWRRLNPTREARLRVTCPSTCTWAGAGGNGLGAQHKEQGPRDATRERLPSLRPRRCQLQGAPLQGTPRVSRGRHAPSQGPGPVPPGMGGDTAAQPVRAVALPQARPRRPQLWVPAAEGGPLTGSTHDREASLPSSTRAAKSPRWHVPGGHFTVQRVSGPPTALMARLWPYDSMGNRPVRPRTFLAWPQG